MKTKISKKKKKKISHYFSYHLTIVSFIALTALLLNNHIKNPIHDIILHLTSSLGIMAMHASSKQR
ncbi:hypothetical protein B0T17DRAFT_519492 [Bombardia bombarda]|uniref:Uncharacterized protein n=1 Tax=Bombardia bombarda TaxID=252184 RepID=A0AA39XM71_9PEZI|nr:hypothetical protein B0T17DRAFT_519492 [Bombardia bombarda]